MKSSKAMKQALSSKEQRSRAFRGGRMNIAEGYCKVTDALEVFLLQAHISPYDFGNRQNHDPTRSRKLLLHHYEIKRLYGQVRESGFTLIPLKLYLKKGLIKIEIALVRGKKIHDKRQTMKKRDAEREIARSFKNQD